MRSVRPDRVWSAAICVVVISVVASTPMRAALAECLIEVFEDANFGGGSAKFDKSRENLAQEPFWRPDVPLGNLKWNDRISSMKVLKGIWKICLDSEFHLCGGLWEPGSQARNFGDPDPAVNPAGTQWQDTISSLKCVSPAAPTLPPSDSAAVNIDCICKRSANLYEGYVLQRVIGLQGNQRITLRSISCTHPSVCQNDPVIPTNGSVHGRIENFSINTGVVYRTQIWLRTQ